MCSVEIQNFCGNVNLTNAHANVSYDAFTVGGVATYTCHQFYSIGGGEKANKRRCVALPQPSAVRPRAGEWDVEFVPSCVGAYNCDSSVLYQLSAFVAGVSWARKAFLFFVFALSKREKTVQYNTYNSIVTFADD